MRLKSIFIENFRCFEKFSVDLEGKSCFVIGENSIGKSSLLSAVVRALGRDLAFQKRDFFDITQAIEIRAVLDDLNDEQLGIFNEAVDFGPPNLLTVGVTVIWDPDSEECRVTHGYPTKDWKRSDRAGREAIDLVWIPDNRETSRLLQLGLRRGLLPDLLSKLDLKDPLKKIAEEIQEAGRAFASTKDLASLLAEAGKHLSRLIPRVGAKPYRLEGVSSTDLDVWKQLQLALEYSGPSLPLAHHSGGLAQLTLFSFLLLSSLKRKGSILLIDEPELALHAHCQRALLGALRGQDSQFLMCTHSAGLLDHADPRRIIRLYRDGKGIEKAQASTLTDEEVAGLLRYMTADNAEALFARKALLVEGPSDKFAVRTLASRLGKNLDAEGISIIAMMTADLLGSYLTLLGPKGLKVELSGLCDVDREARWARLLETHGLGRNLTRSTMAKLGFHVCDKDLEDVLIAAIGTSTVISLIDTLGHKAAFEKFAKQPGRAGKNPHDNLRDFVHDRSVRYAPLLVELLDIQKLPAPLRDVIDGL